MGEEGKKVELVLQRAAPTANEGKKIRHSATGLSAVYAGGEIRDSATPSRTKWLTEN